MLLKKFIQPLCLIFGLAFWSHAQPFDPILASQLQSTLNQFRTGNNLKGISASVFIPGSGTWTGVSGISHTGVPVSPAMQFGIGSNTKLFTGVLLLKLSESNLLQLDDPIHEYLPPLNHVDSNITIRQLLNHTSGLADVTGVPGYSDSILSNPNRIFSPNEVIRWIGPPSFAPGTGFEYSNTNYLLAGMIAEIAGGQSFGTLLRNLILSPLQMDSTYLDVFDTVPPPIAHPWQNGNDNFSVPRKALNSSAWAAGAMYSTATEMVHWYRSLMGGQVLNAASFSEMTTFSIPGNYGIGLYQTPVQGRTVWQHGGTIWGGYNSSMVYDTAGGFVICVLINQNPAQAFAAARQLLSAILSSPVAIRDRRRSGTGIRLLPNPASGVLDLEVPGEEVLDISVFHTTGKRIPLNSTPPVSVAGLPPGLYFLQVRTDRGHHVGRWRKE